MAHLVADDDLLGAEALRDPYTYFARLRAADPVHWNPRHRSWVVTRYQDVHDLFRDSRLSSNRVLPHFDGRRPGRGDNGWMPAVRSILAQWMVFKDPPEHTRLRRLVYPAFTPKAIHRLADRIGEVVDELIDDLAAAAGGPGGADFIRTFAFPLPAIAIAELLGVPPSDRDTFKTWSDALHPLVFGALDDPDRHERAAGALLELSSYFRELMAHYRRRPADNLVSSLLEHQRREASPDDELVAMSVLLLFAGHETTTNLLGNGVLALLRHAGQFERLRTDPALVPQAVEEILRYDGPAKLSVRWAVDDLHVGTARIRAGQRVLLVQAAANHDPSVFDRADDLVLDRRDNPHLAFGVGIHYCLGAPLARLEATTTLERMSRRGWALALEPGELAWHPTMLIRGVRELPLRVT